jgi:hypothetical protein
VKDFGILAIVFVVIMLAFSGIYFIGVVYDRSLLCKTCDPNFGLTKYAAIPYQIIAFFTFIPFFIYQRLIPLIHITPDPDLNGTLAIFIAIYLYLFGIALISIITIFLFSFFNKPKSDPFIGGS